MLPKYLLKTSARQTSSLAEVFCVLFLCQRPDRSDHTGGIDFYLLQRHCAAVDALQQVVIITLVAGHWKNAALCQTGKQGRKTPVLWWNDPKQPER